MAKDPTETLGEVLDYMNTDVLPSSQSQKNYKVFENAMKLIYALSLSLTSINCLERLFHDRVLLDLMSKMTVHPDKKGFFARIFDESGKMEAASAMTEIVFTLWTDLTLVY